MDMPQGPPGGGGPPGTPIMPSPADSTNSGENMYTMINTVPPGGNRQNFPIGPGGDGPMGGMAGMEPHHMNGSLGSADMDSMPKNSPGNLSMSNQPGTPRDDGEMGGNFLNPFQNEIFSKHDHECVKTSFGNPGGFHHMTWNLCKRAVASPLLLSEEYGSKPLLSLSFLRFLFFFRHHSFTFSAASHRETEAEPRWGESDDSTTCLYLRDLFFRTMPTKNSHSIRTLKKILNWGMREERPPKRN
ncbi:Single-stranded DNA-binding protein 2 [Labeo rohita]|uniref:Single-stranded DNA-binding protein 2 n=1 Tax=Labeo rohita TaxID=84645 RepID=A0ABQ8MCK1_LABRO|nr:Single-stranded DNA-binding protein 2 [Labeo rohita]